MMTQAHIAAAVQRAAACFAQAEDQLNAADAKLGDGDTGGMLNRLASGLAKVDLSAAQDPSSAFSDLARAASASTGSSLGTLVMTALMTFAKETRGQDSIDLGDLPRLISGARDAMLKRGGAALGDKTVIDGLAAVAAALETAQPASFAQVAASASKTALDEFRDRPNRIGRARMYGEKSQGLDDPGMLAFSLLCAALAEPLGKPSDQGLST